MLMTHTLAKRQVEWLSVLMFLFMLALALIPGVKAVAGLPSGASIDFHRDEAFVRALLEGHYGEDPTYLGGVMWYTPLMTWVEAATVVFTGLPAAEAIVRMGAYAGLLAPLAFFIMAWYFLGPVRAVTCTAVFLFFSIGHEPGWAVPTYSPRMISVSFCQWFFYLEVILIDRAFRSTRIGPSMIAGAGAGITFLAHAGPAMIAVLLFGIFAMVDLSAALRRKDRGAAWARTKACIAAGVAFIVATLPLTWYIGGAYHMHVVNRSGFLYTYYAVTLREKGLFLYHNLSVVNLFALAGVWIVFLHARHAGVSMRARALFLTWLWLTLVLFMYSYAVAVLDTHYAIHLPPLLPTYHFYFYAKGALTVFAGVAAWEFFAWGWMRLRPVPGHKPLSMGTKPVVVLFAVIALACTLNYPAYATRRDLFCVRNRNLAFMERTAGIEAADDIHALLPWDAVVLCDVDLSIYPMLPTARHVVSTASTMGNPYLDQSQRQKDNALLLLGMQAPRPDTKELLDKYSVTHLLVRPSDLPLMPEVSHWFPTEVFRNNGYVLLAR
jgi:hypothetical protein